MGCVQSAEEKGPERVFGATGVHVGRHGDVDLTSRAMEAFGPKFVELIKRDRFHDAKRLHLSDNKLYTLGKEMIMLPDIEELFINGNRFQRVPVVLRNMPKLRFLDISGNELGMHEYSLTVLPRIESLKHVVLRDCGLTGIPQCILSCPVLEILDLSDNQHLELRDTEFSKLTALNTLLIANCGVAGELPNGIKEIKTLQSLDISENLWAFDDADFFGKWMPMNLLELHLRALQLRAVPQVVVSLRKLTYLDLAENPLETLDVLAGRYLRRALPQGASTNTERLTRDENDCLLGGSSQMNESKRGNMSASGRAEMIVQVVQPIQLERLCLRDCNLCTVPKYFHKLTSLVNIDLSGNEQLDDENLTLFSFPDLQVLNIVGCPFAVHTGISSNVWSDIGKLRNLHTLNWDVWKGMRNVSPYRTRIPVEICGLRLRQVNDLKLRPKLFVGETVQTVVNLLVDGYFKVDFSMDDDLVYSHAEALHALHPLESFFFKTELLFDGTERLGEIVPEVLQICVNRYIFFLTVQAANYNVVIIPPADVMAIHYAQMTQNPTHYRKDCEAICGQVLNCNYRFFFLERKLKPNAVNKALVSSKRVWNMMIRASQQDLKWLRYDFWDKRGGGSHSCGELSLLQRVIRSTPLIPSGNSMSGPSCGPAAPPPCASDCVSDLGSIDSVGELRTVLDQSITSYFAEQGLKVFEDSLVQFFDSNRVFIKYENILLHQSIDWTRYVKYLTLVAYVHRVQRFGGKPAVPQMGDSSLTIDMVANNSLTDEHSYLPRPPSDTSQAPPRVTFGPVIKTTKSELQNYPRVPRRRASSFLSRHHRIGGRVDVAEVHNLALQTHLVPTVGIRLLLHSHRTAHAKYYQVLLLLGIEDDDIIWEKSSKGVGETIKLWEALYKERYVDRKGMNITFDDQELMTTIPTPSQDPATNMNTMYPLQSAMKRNSSKKQRRVQLSL